MRAHHFEGMNVMANFLRPHCKPLFTRCVDHPHCTELPWKGTQNKCQMNVAQQSKSRRRSQNGCFQRQTETGPL